MTLYGIHVHITHHLNMQLCGKLNFSCKQYVTAFVTRQDDILARNSTNEIPEIVCFKIIVRLLITQFIDSEFSI